jgi:inner membrane protein
LPLLLSMVNGEIGARRSQFPGRGLPTLALVLMASLWGYRALQHDDAGKLVQAQEFRGGRLMRASLNPYPINPYRWHAVVETPESFQSGTVDTRRSLFESDPQQIYAKPPVTLATLAAKQSWLGQVYLDWSKYPLAIDAGTAGEIHPEMELSASEAALRVVQFSDLRFRYDVLGRRSGSEPPLSAEAWVNSDRQVVRAFLGGVEQRGAH